MKNRVKLIEFEYVLWHPIHILDSNDSFDKFTGGATSSVCRKIQGVFYPGIISKLVHFFYLHCRRGKRPCLNAPYPKSCFAS